MDNQTESHDMGHVWKVAFGGSALVGVAAAISIVKPDATGYLAALQMLLVTLGALAVAVAVKMHPTQIRLLILASGTCVVGYFGIPAEWDSMRMVASFGAIVAAVGAGLVALPVNYRKIAVSVLVLLHFGGILTAVTSPPTQPWLGNMIGTGFYRPYMQFMYLVNAYHFYSPQPGPASQLWFCIKYKPDANGIESTRWFKMPRRPEDMTDPLALSYYRRLSLTQQLETTIPAIISDEQRRARMMAQGADTGDGSDNSIPIHPEIMPLDSQYRMPPDSIRDHILPSYVRHVANMRENQHDDGVTGIDTIKVYLVEHSILLPEHWKAGYQPYDEPTYRPYYFGEFDITGTLRQPADPLLYWLVPILWEPKDPNIPPWHTQRTHPEEFRILDGVKRQTGSDHNLTRKGRP